MAVVQVNSATFKHAFPFEIMGQILEHAVQVIHDGANPKFLVSPHTLSQVCRSWQSYLDATPSFWSAIIVSLRQAERWRQIYLSGLHDWVDRAAHLPLDIYLDGEVGVIGPDTRHYICKFLVDCCSQWRSLDTHSVDASFAHIFQTLTYSASLARTRVGHPPLSLPLLQSYVVRGPRGLNDAPLLTKLERVLSLRTLQIDGYDDRLAHLRFDPDSITSVTLTNVHNIVVYTIDILSSYSSVKTVEIHHLAIKSSTLQFEGKRVRHNHIRSLKILARTSTDITYSLPRLQTPKLEDLHLHAHDVLNEEWFDIVPSIEEFVTRSGCYLVRLTLQTILFHESQFIRMLSNLPGLNELYVRHVEAPQSRHMFRGLTRAFFHTLHPDSNISFLPNLRILTYEGPLAIESLDPLEALVFRLQPKRTSSVLDALDNVPGSQRSSLVRLNFAKIMADQKGRLFNSARDPISSEILEQMRLLVERNALWLLNADGSKWK